MEIAGTAIGVVGLLGLYSTCIEMLDTLSAAARYGIDREVLQTKIGVEKVRLMIWGDAVGLTELDLDPSTSEKDLTEDDLSVLDDALQRQSLRTAVAGLLACFVRTFEDAEELQKRYGLVVAKQPEGSDGSKGSGGIPDEDARATRDILLATFRKTYSNFQTRVSSSQRKTNPLIKARWAISDERKFRELIVELKAINDSLMGLLPAIRNKTRVKMRAEIMQSTDIGQLQNLVNAADDAADLVSETATLRLEMLSTKGSAMSRKPAPRLVLVVNPSVPQPVHALEPSPPVARVPSPLPVSVPKPYINESSSPSVPQISTQEISKPQVPVLSPSGPYNDTGALVIHKVYYKPNCLSCFSWLSGIGEAPELSAIQPVAHPAFEFMHIPASILPVARGLVEIDVEADPNYAGWSSGSTSLAGFAREATFWREFHTETERTERHWVRAADRPSIKAEFLKKRWAELAKNGLGKDWTEKKGYHQVRELTGPSEYQWLNPDEAFKVRHQISDLLACMSTSPVLNLETAGSIGYLANYDKFNPNAPFSFLDLLLQLLEAREVLLRIQHEKRKWYGGITVRIVYDLIAAELWNNNMPIKEGDELTFEPTRKTKEVQLSGIVKFVEEMKWPYADEVRVMANTLLSDKGSQLAVDTRVWEWTSGLVLPGAMYPMAMLGVIYNMSTTLQPQMPSATVQARKGNYGIVYPQASYWSSRSILGKVLAPLSRTSSKGVKCFGGWVGPCPSPSLPESLFGLIAELKSRPPTFVEEDTDLEGDGSRVIIPTMESKRGNTTEWTEPLPPSPSTDSAELQVLRLTKVQEQVDTDTEGNAAVGDHKSHKCQARLDFRLSRSGSLISMALHTNSIYISAPPCRGTHRVDPVSRANYTFRVIGIEELLTAELDAGHTGSAAITVINATGGGGAEALARAWCSEKGTSAVIWKRDGGNCCFKCGLMLAGKDGLATGVLISC